jgi:hypothetical protein
MINRIADEIAYRIKNGTTWVETSVGIVKPVTSKSKGGADVTEPIYFNTERNFCNGADYISLAPNSSKKSICYFEINGKPRVEDSGRKGTSFVATLTAIVWVNYNKINIGMIDTDILVADFLQTLPQTLPADGYYNRVILDVSGVEIHNGDVFSKYSYNEQQQYLMYPYDYFTVDINVSYTIPKGCFDLVLNPNECNLKPTVVVSNISEVDSNHIIKY